MRQRSPVLAGITTALLLALLLAVGGWVASVKTGAAPSATRSSVDPVPAPPTGWGPPPQTPPPDTPRPGRAYPVRALGALPARSTTVRGQGNAELRYRRLAGNGTAVHFRCAGCTEPTWLVETARPWPLGGGPLTTPDDYRYVTDTVDLHPANGVLVHAVAAARWELTLTPFDALPLQAGALAGEGGAVVRVPAAETWFRCSGASFAKSFGRASGEPEHEVGTVLSQDSGGRWSLARPEGATSMVVVLQCAGRWGLDPG